MSSSNSKNDQEIDRRFAFFVFIGVVLLAIFTGIVKGIVMLFEQLMPFLLCFFCLVFLVLAVVLVLLMIAGIWKASRGELGSSLGEFSRGIRGQPAHPLITYTPHDPAEDRYTIDIPAQNCQGSASAQAASNTSDFRDVPPPPDPAPAPFAAAAEPNAIELVRADIMDAYVLHTDRIATIYPYAEFLSDIDSTIYYLSDSYRSHIEMIKAKIELALKIATIIDLRNEAVAAYNRAPREIRKKLPKDIVREHILTLYRKRFSLDLIKTRHRTLLQKIDAVSLHVKEAAAKETPPKKQPDPRVLKARQEREALKRACRAQAEKNVRKFMPNEPAYRIAPLVLEEEKRLLRNALEQEEQEEQEGEFNDQTPDDTDTLAA